MKDPLIEENVWDYPRPAICEPFNGHLKIIHNGIVLAETTNGFRTLETSHPPTYYFPVLDVQLDCLRKSTKRTFCEWKGQAGYYDYVSDHKTVHDIGWYYSSPTQDFLQIQDYVSFYASKVDQCFVNGEEVMAQEGDFYGGWITSNLKGPFKGGPGTHGW